MSAGPGRPGHADVRRGLNAVPAIEPAVRPPAQAVGDVVPHDAVVPAVEHDLRLAVGDVVAVAVGKEQQPGRTEGPHAAEADLDAGQLLSLVPKDRLPVGPAVMVGVFQDHDPVVLRQVEIHLRVGVGVILRHPEAAAGIGRHSDRLAKHGLRREERDMKARRSTVIPAAACSGGVSLGGGAAVFGGGLFVWDSAAKPQVSAVRTARPKTTHVRDDERRIIRDFPAQSGQGAGRQNDLISGAKRQV